MIPNSIKRQKHTTLLLEDHISSTFMANAPLLATLPDVVLSEVFLWAIVLADGRPRKHEAPLNLSQTCRSLRVFALSQSRFWAHINLTLLNCFDKLSFSMSSLWLERSDDLPLDVSVDVECLTLGKQSIVDGKFNTVSKMVVGHSRWKRLLLRNGPRMGSQFPGWVVTDLSQLRELGVGSIMIERDSGMSGNPTVLSLNSAIKFSTISATQAPIATQLVHLHIIGSCNRKSLVAMLDHCPALECLNIGSGDKHDLPLIHTKGDIGPSGTNSRLSRIGIFGFLDLLSVFGGIRAPAFEALEILVYDDLDQLAPALFSSQIGSSIRRANLYFSKSKVHEGSLYEYRDDVYIEMPNVMHLVLNLSEMPFDGPYASYDFESLSFEARGRGRFPKLEYLELTVSAEVATDSLERMLASRMLHSDRFRAVIATKKWTMGRSKAFLISSRIKPWVDSGRLKVLSYVQKSRSSAR